MNNYKSVLTSLLPSPQEMKQFTQSDWKAFNNEMKKHFCAHFKVLIKNSSLTQREIAQKLGYESHVIISMIKNGKAKIPLDKADQYAEVLGVDKKPFIIDTLIAYKPQLFNELRTLLINESCME